MSDQDTRDNLPPGEDGHNEKKNGAYSPGAQLAAAREERGWTIEQVASQLNLAPRQVIALETDNYAALPGLPIIRGFTRSYAKLLHIDAAPLLSVLAKEAQSSSEISSARPVTTSKPFAETRMPPRNPRQVKSSRWKVGTLILAVAGLIAWWVQNGFNFTEVVGKTSPAMQSDAEGLTSAERSSNVPDSPSTSVQPSDLPNTTASTTAQEGPSPSPGQVSSTTSGSVGGNESENSRNSAISASQTLQGVVDPAASRQKNALVLNVKTDSWVEIKRTGNNSVLLSRIVKSGESETIDVSEPVSIVIGNVSGVDATFRGAPLNIKSSDNSNVARLTLK